MELSNYEQKSLKKLEETIKNGHWSNDALVELIKLTGEYLNIKTVPKYATDNKMSYPGAIKETKNRKLTIIFDTKFIIDNN